MDLQSAGASIEPGVTTGSISIYALVSVSNSIVDGYCARMSISSLISTICGVSLSSLSVPVSSALSYNPTTGISILTLSGSNAVRVSGGTPWI